MTEAVKDAVIVNSTQGLARLDPQALISQAIQAGAGIEALERLVALATTVRAMQAREAWYASMAEFQRRCPVIKKTKTAKIRTRTGPGYEYKFAPIEQILSPEVRAVLADVGFSVSWRRPGVTASSVTVSCRVSHVLGHHEESGDVAMPVSQQAAGDEASGATPAQRVGIASTYAERYALKAILGLVAEDDDDTESQGTGADETKSRDPAGGLAGAVITEQEVRKFFAIARGHGWTDAERHDLLTSLGVNKVEEIPAVKYTAVLERLKARVAK